MTTNTLTQLVNSLVLFMSFSYLTIFQVAAAENTVTSSKNSPNILLIIADDFGMDVTSTMYPQMIDDLLEQYGPKGHNHPNYKEIDGEPASTPTLDQLAQEGMVFTNVWAHPFCSPTRASILTGLFSAQTKVLTYADPLSQQHTSFVELLRTEGGYSTALFGKWHLAGLPTEGNYYLGIKPSEAGFDLFKGNLHAAIRTYWDYDYQIQDSSTRASEWITTAPPQLTLPGIRPTTFAPVVKAADTISWIRTQKKENPDTPWFAWLAFNLSHATTIQQPSAMAVPDIDTLDAISKKEMELCGAEFSSNNTGNCSGEALMRAMTNAMDTVLAKVLDAVEEIDPNTYIIFISDNGTPMYARPNLDFIDNMYITKQGRGKGTAYESGLRVAMSISGPGVQAQTQSGEFVHAGDLFSTTLALAGVAVPELVSNSEGTDTVPVNGLSLTPILFQNETSLRDPSQDFLITESINLMTGGTSHVGARNKDYKIVCVDGFELGACEFYDLSNDPLEEYPLSKPESCDAYADGDWSPSNQDWHYCHLIKSAN